MIDYLNEDPTSDIYHRNIIVTILEVVKFFLQGYGSRSSCFVRKRNDTVKKSSCTFDKTSLPFADSVLGS